MILGARAVTNSRRRAHALQPVARYGGVLVALRTGEPWTPSEPRSFIIVNMALMLRFLTDQKPVASS